MRKRLGWILSITVLITLAGAYYGYTTYMVSEPKPIEIPMEERFFQDDGTSLDWLEKENPDVAEESAAEPTIDNNEKPEITETAVDSKEPHTSREAVGDGHRQAAHPNNESPVAPELTGNTQVTKEQHLAAIKQKYKVRFKGMERDYQGKLKGLIGEAHQEYIAMNEGHLETSKVELAAKYLRMAKQMEKEADKQFYNALAQMEQELEDHEISTEKILQQAKLEYKQRKDNQRAALMKKFTQNL
jgi:hypothetical protein